MVFVAAAADDPRKRVIDVIDAWPAVADAIPGARLRIAGHAAAATRRMLVERLPPALAAQVSFLGLLDDRQLATEYSAAWCSAVPAVYEALGLTTLEALACGTPVAGARSGATPELLADVGTGVLFEATRPDDAAAAIVATMALATTMPTTTTTTMTTAMPADSEVRERCRRAALRYSWPPLVDRIESRYRALVDRIAA